MWQCPKCGVEVEDSLKLCWICGTSPDGTEHPGYPSAGEPGKVVGGLVKAIKVDRVDFPRPRESPAGSAWTS